MDIRKLENIMKLMRRYKISDLSIEDNELGQKVQLSSTLKLPGKEITPANGYTEEVSYEPESVGEQEIQPSVAPKTSSGSSQPESSSSESKNYIRSPFVGTYYASPSPDSESFVKVGQKVNKGDVLCIVEAMKLMNEIEAETSGIIKEILVKNAEPVEYDQPIFVIG